MKILPIQPSNLAVGIVGLHLRDFQGRHNQLLFHVDQFPPSVTLGCTKGCARFPTTHEVAMAPLARVALEICMNLSPIVSRCGRNKGRACSPVLLNVETTKLCPECASFLAPEKPVTRMSCGSSYLVQVPLVRVIFRHQLRHGLRGICGII